MKNISIKRKMLSVAITFILSFVVLATSVLAATYNTNFSFNSGNQCRGYVDGSLNNVYYAFNSGTVTPNLSCTSGSGTMYVALMRYGWLGTYVNMGTKNWSNLNQKLTSAWTTDQNTNYFIVASGSIDNTDYAANGSLTQ